jgi:hypothetical protein
MKPLILSLCIAMSAGAFAQLTNPLMFSEESFDFGYVNEEGGAVTHEFVFNNNTNRPVRILSVQASCGCTTPAWSKEPVAPGKTGFIQASYNPRGRPGYFNKSLTVTTDLNSSPIVLQIKGQVSTDGESSNPEFQAANGNWKLRSGSFNLGKVYREDNFTVRDFPVVNGGAQTITYTGKFEGPPYVKVDVQPRTLAPGQKGHITVSYHGKMKGDYGFQSDNITLLTDDALNAAKSFSVYATLEDKFTLTPEELAGSAQLRLQEQMSDFGRIKPNETTVKEVQFINTGRAPLEIRSVKGNCTCIQVKAKKTTLKPGESGMLSIAFNPYDRKGTQQKSVTIYSNDPRNPVQRLVFTAYVED